jgi:hypothetical protein
MTLLALYSKFPSLDCGACFVPTCKSFARRCLLGLNSPYECPVLGWAEGGRGATEAESALNAHRGVTVRGEAEILGTNYSLRHPATNGKIADFLDMETLAELAQASRVFDSAKPFAKLGALRLSKGPWSYMVVSDGRVLPTGPGPPQASALSALASLMWGAVSGFRPILPAERHDSIGVRGWRLQRMPDAVGGLALMPDHRERPSCCG